MEKARGKTFIIPALHDPLNRGKPFRGTVMGFQGSLCQIYCRIPPDGHIWVDWASVRRWPEEKTRGPGDNRHREEDTTDSDDESGDMEWLQGDIAEDPQPPGRLAAQPRVPADTTTSWARDAKEGDPVPKSRLRPQDERKTTLTQPALTRLRAAEGGALAAFDLFFTPSLTTLVVNETNAYALQSLVSAGKDPSKWKMIVEAEFKSFLGALLLMDINQLPSLSDYWDESSNPCFGNDGKFIFNLCAP